MTELEYVKTLLEVVNGKRSLFWRGWGFVEEWPVPNPWESVGELTTYAWSGDGHGGIHKNPFMGSPDTDEEWLDRCLRAASFIHGPTPPNHPIDGVPCEIHEISDLIAYLAALESFKANAV